MALPRYMKVWLLAGVLLLVLGIVLGVWWLRPRFDAEEVRSVVVSTIQREAPASFYVTGALDLAVTVTAERGVFLLPDNPLIPDALRFRIGSDRARIQIPGRVSYGFDIRRLREEDIEVLENGIVEITLPDLSVYAVEPYLERMQVEVDNQRIRLDDPPPIQQAAMARVREAMQRQAEQHLESSSQPRINTADALERMLEPVLQAAGLPDPAFRFRIGPRIIMEPEG